ncbi:RusA family crossover junction endodeoxyribonuclease [Dyadobacter sandarakinus]|uniref:RusA family crossover junction endodeoxyribonuclease n=1 Tax=Dyadobacter sandarakinus TaxID=2747268 RepID=A0ABX7I3E0_9BACT|nr:RusA family crossover junction endodeoxyribonuclease [Dyadobacter sandarakinus]QRQ99762.1 RusA family crossover junction endodeoxyribonuclease [Dyadobacter sandarakinus]
MTERQTILGTPPSKSNSYRIVSVFSKKMGKIHSTLAKTPALLKYEKDFFIQCNQYRNAMIDEYFELYADVFYPNQRSDLDNSAKALLDCLQTVNAIKNDNKCTKLVLNKYVDKDRPRIEFQIIPSMKQ